MKRIKTYKLCGLLLAVVLAAGSVPCRGKAASASQLIPTTEIISGENYVLAVDSLKAEDGRSLQRAVTGETASVKDGLASKVFPSDSGKVTTEIMWCIEKTEDNYYTFYNQRRGRYLNLTSSGASLSSEPKKLSLGASGNRLTVFKSSGGTCYYLRFTATQNCGRWSTGETTQSGTFTFYRFGAPELEEYDSDGKTPLLTVACFSDLHIDYGLQHKSSPVREDTMHAAEEIIKRGGVDVVLVGGDILSGNDTKTGWTNAEIEAAKQAVSKTLSPVSKTGNVFYVSGNHDTQPGNLAGGTVDSSDYSEIMKAACGEFEDALIQTVDGKECLLAYRYTVGGIAFIGINTPYSRSAKDPDSGLFSSQIHFAEQQLKEIGRNQTAVLFCHYPIQSVTSHKGETANVRNELQLLLNQYPNVIWCYGHVHSTDRYFASYQTSELVNSPMAEPVGPNTANTSKYIACHMGSMGYYDYSYQPGALNATARDVVQVQTIEFYEDHITFRTVNTGPKTPSEVAQPASWTVLRDLRAQFGIEIPSDETGDNTEDFGPSDSDSLPSDSAAGLPDWVIPLSVTAVVLILSGVGFLLGFHLYRKHSESKK